MGRQLSERAGIEHSTCNTFLTNTRILRTNYACRNKHFPSKTERQCPCKSEEVELNQQSTVEPETPSLEAQEVFHTRVRAF